MIIGKNLDGDDDDDDEINLCAGCLRACMVLYRFQRVVHEP